MRLRTVVLGITLGILLCSIGFFVWAILNREPPLPPFSSQTLAQAEERWQAHGPANYNLRIVIRGKEGGDFRLQVRNGEVISCTRDGIPPRRHTWDVWSVPGQFGTLARELDGIAEPHKMFPGAAAHTRVLAEAEFHPELGYLLRYRRHVLGADLTTEWETLEFDAVPAASE